MSISLSNVQQVEFDALVKAQYASRGFLLRDSIRMRRDVIGQTVQFRKVGQIIAVPTGYMQSVTPQDPGYTPEVATLQKYTAPCAVDTVQELTVNFDVKMENAMLVADAMGRQSDQVIINAFVGNASTTIPTNTSNFTYLKYTQLIQYFEQNAVPLGERWVAMSGACFRSLLNQDQFVSTFYTQNRVLDRGFVREYLGFNVVVIPNMKEGGLPLSGTVRSCFAWHRQAAGMGIGHDFRTEINYLPRETSWLINGVFSIGATVIDNLGLIQINCDESL